MQKPLGQPLPAGSSQPRLGWSNGGQFRDSPLPSLYINEPFYNNLQGNVPVLFQRKRLRLREVKSRVQSHTAGEGLGQNQNWVSVPCGGCCHSWYVARGRLHFLEA